MARTYFVSGIGTEVGKTLVSAVLCEAWSADYWKPIQSGCPPDRDSDTVRSLLTNSRSIVHSERFVLKEPLSPHVAAAMEGIEIMLPDLLLPKTDNTLLIEGAGGLMVPLNYSGDMMIDLIAKFNASCILVSRHYLGSINHTLLSIQMLKMKGIDLAGVVFTGSPMPDTEETILDMGEVKCIGRVPQLSAINANVIYELTRSEKYEA